MLPYLQIKNSSIPILWDFNQRKNKPALNVFSLGFGKIFH
jgi:hypothetical protein